MCSSWSPTWTHGWGTNKHSHNDACNVQSYSSEHFQVFYNEVNGQHTQMHNGSLSQTTHASTNISFTKRRENSSDN